MGIEFQQVEVYYVETNSDLTEGRGYPITIAVSPSKATAYRLSKGKGIQGSDANVIKGFGYMIEGRLFVNHYTKPTHADSMIDKKEKEEQEIQEKKLALIQKMKDKGFSDDEINLVVNRGY